MSSENVHAAVACDMGQNVEVSTCTEISIGGAYSKQSRKLFGNV